MLQDPRHCLRSAAANTLLGMKELKGGCCGPAMGACRCGMVTQEQVVGQAMLQILSSALSLHDANGWLKKV